MPVGIFSGCQGRCAKKIPGGLDSRFSGHSPEIFDLAIFDEKTRELAEILTTDAPRFGEYGGVVFRISHPF